MSLAEKAATDVDDLAEQRRYWIDKLAGGPRPAGPRPDHRRPEHRSERSAAAAFEIDGETFDRLEKLTSGEPFLEYAALAAALTACLYRHTQASPIVIGCPAMKSETEPADPGTLVPIVNDVDGQMSFRQLLLGVRQTLLDAHARQHYPYSRLLDDLALPAAPNRCPLFDVSLAYGAVHHEMPEAGNDVALNLRREPGRMRGTAMFSPELYETATIERFSQHLVCLLSAGLENSRAALAELDMLAAEERRQLLVGWNDTAHEYPRELCVHELFEAQAARAPGSVALVDGDRRLTYQELNDRANQLAHRLQKLGVGANTPAGVCMNRSAELVV
ncbi:MAG TPA: condensation domain-containing protein, partial [Thermoanaerobaculia bacterium]